nr:hypothetical protein [Ilumatobacter sp.]
MISQNCRRARWGTQIAVGAAIVLTACGPLTNSDDSTSAPNSAASKNTTTIDPTTSMTENAASTTTVEVARPASGISFADEVLPILETNCASCHTANGPGTAHLVLETAGDISDFDAEYIAAVIDGGYMPPWPAADGDVAFHDD